MHNLFLTGEVGIGKSTILRNVIERINLSIGGYITERKTQDYITTFIVKSLYNSMEEHIIANINTINKSKKIYKDSFEIAMSSILENSLKSRDLIVLDELGFMENDIDIFTSKVYKILDSKKPVFGVLKDFDCQFLNNIRSRDDVIILEVTKESRNTILNIVIDVLESFGVIFKKENSFMWNETRIDWYNEALEHPNCDYPYVFIKEIKKYTGSLKGKSILDIGAGTGAFSIPLMEEGAYITAVDSSSSMMSSLCDRAKKKNLNKINCIIGPFERSKPDKHNIAISAFSGGSTKDLKGIKKMHSLVEEYGFIIASFESQEHNFKRNILYEMLNRPPQERKAPNTTLKNTLERLDYSGYSYDCKKIEYELSQYFNDFNEALDFFINRYNIIKPREIKITEDFINRYLIKEDDQYKFGNIKSSWLITIRVKSN